jgi:putative transposase
MPRHARLDAPGLLHHIIIRGIERKPIFSGDRDRKDFIERCSILFPETMTACYAWSLLSNHVHMLVRTGAVPLATVMARLLTGYATSYNVRHKRSGHLFQNRYKSVICQEDAYFKQLVRYIHLNPVRAGLSDLDGLDTFPWSGHTALLSRKERLWQDTGYVLSVFGSQASYREFVHAGIDQGQRHDLTGGGLLRSHGGWVEVRTSRSLIKGDDRILGDTSFVTMVLARAEDTLERRCAMRRSGMNLDAVEKRVADLFGMASSELHAQGRYRRLGEARSVFCFFAVRELGIPMKALAEKFSLTGPAIGYSVKRGEKIAQERGWTLCEGE